MNNISKAKQSKAKQSKAKQSKAKQSKAKHCSDSRFECLPYKCYSNSELYNSQGRPGNIEYTKNRKWCCCANLKRIEKFNIDIAMTIMARDYKGFGNGLVPMNGVIEEL